MSDKQTSAAAKITRECLGLRLRITSRVINKIYNDALRPLGIHSTQVAMLAFAVERGVLRQADLCTELQLDDSTLSRNLERMRAKGWIEEVAGEDPRERPYRMTAKGASLFKRVMPAWEKAQREARRLLGVDGAQVIRRFAREQGLTM